MSSNWRHNADGLEDEKQREAQLLSVPNLTNGALIIGSGGQLTNSSKEGSNETKYVCFPGQLSWAVPIFERGGVSATEIDSAESTLGVTFSKDYREFLERFGGAIVGPYPVYGLRRADPMDERLWSVVGVTNYFRSQAWPGAENWYVISMDHAGNPIGVDNSGKLLSFDHDAGEIVEVAPNLETYLLECLQF